VIEGVQVVTLALVRSAARLRRAPTQQRGGRDHLALLELGHPLHGFDLDKLAGRRIVVRRAREGEPLTTLDGKERKLSADDLVNRGWREAVALAG